MSFFLRCGKTATANQLGAASQRIDCGGNNANANLFGQPAISGESEPRSTGQVLSSSQDGDRQGVIAGDNLTAYSPDRRPTPNAGV